MCSITRSPFESVSSSISSILVVVLTLSGVLFLLFVLYFTSFISICCFRLQISSFSWLSSLFSVILVSASSLSSLMVCLLSSSWAFMFSIVLSCSRCLVWWCLVGGCLSSGVCAVLWVVCRVPSEHSAFQFLGNYMYFGSWCEVYVVFPQWVFGLVQFGCFRWCCWGTPWWSFCYSRWFHGHAASVGGQLYQLVWEVVGFKLLGGSFQGFIFSIVVFRSFFFFFFLGPVFFPSQVLWIGFWGLFLWFLLF